MKQKSSQSMRYELLLINHPTNILTYFKILTFNESLEYLVNQLKLFFVQYTIDQQTEDSLQQQTSE
jgi:hypothetical protein